MRRLAGAGSGARVRRRLANWWWVARMLCWARVGQVTLWLSGWTWAAAREQVELEVRQILRHAAWAQDSRRPR